MVNDRLRLFIYTLKRDGDNIPRCFTPLVSHQKCCRAELPHLITFLMRNCLETWGCAFKTQLHCLFLLQKRLFV